MGLNIYCVGDVKRCLARLDAWIEIGWHGVAYKMRSDGSGREDN